MPEATPEVVTPPVVVEPAPVEQTTEAKPLGENGEKALKAERDARKAAEKAIAEMATRLKSFEDRDKSESEKLADRAQAAEERANKAETDAVRFRIAAKHHIGEEDFDLLGSGSADEIEDRAKRIAAKNAAAVAKSDEKPALPTDKPVAKLRPGATGAETSLTPPNMYPSTWLVPGRVTN